MKTKLNFILACLQLNIISLTEAKLSLHRLYPTHQHPWTEPLIQANYSHTFSFGLANIICFNNNTSASFIALIQLIDTLNRQQSNQIIKQIKTLIAEYNPQLATAMIASDYMSNHINLKQAAKKLLTYNGCSPQQSTKFDPKSIAQISENSTTANFSEHQQFKQQLIHAYRQQILALDTQIEDMHEAMHSAINC